MTTQPPLLALADGRRVRPRKPPVIRPKELDLHLAVAGTLRRFIAPGWLWGHYPAGEHRHARMAAKLKAMGVQRGWPDIILFSPFGQVYGLELKWLGEGLADEQEAFQVWAITHGVPYAVARSVDEALAILGAWRCLRVDIRTGGAA